MDVRALRRVVVLARLLSYTKAAEQLGISQSVLSRSIQEVERRVNVRLFDRDRAGVHLTPAGRAFVERAAVILSDVDDLDRMVERIAGGAGGKVAVGVEHLSASALVPGVLAEDLASDLDLEVFVAVRRPAALLPLLLNEEIEFLICTEGALAADAPLKSSFIGWYPLSLLVRAGHPLLEPGCAASARAFPVIAGNYFGRTAVFPQYFWDYLRDAPRMVVEDYDSLARLAQESDAIWVSSTFAAAEAVAQGRLVEIRPPPGAPVGRVRAMAYSLDRRSISPAAARLQSRMRCRLNVLWARFQQGPEAPVGASPAPAETLDA